MILNDFAVGVIAGSAVSLSVLVAFSYMAGKKYSGRHKEVELEAAKKEVYQRLCSEYGKDEIDEVIQKVEEKYDIDSISID